MQNDKLFFYGYMQLNWLNLGQDILPVDGIHAFLLMGQG